MNDDLIVLHKGKQYRIPQYSLENSSSSFQMFFWDAFSNTFVMPNNIGEPAVTAFVQCMQQNESTIEEKIGEYDISKLFDLLLLSEALVIDDLEQWCLRAIKPISDAATHHLTELGGSDHLADLSDHAIERFLAAEIITEFEVTSLASLPWSSLAPSINLILDKLGEKLQTKFIMSCVKAHGIEVLYHEDVMKRLRLDNSELTSLEMFIPSCERTSEVRHHFDIWRERNEFERCLCDVIMKNKNSIGYFYAGRSLYQNGDTDRLKELGLKMIQESAKAGIFDAKLFPVTWNITKRDFRNARNEILKLISNGMNVDDLVSLLDKYPEVRLCEEKEWFDNYLRGGYLRSRASDPEKAALVNFYVNYISDDVSVIAETLPDCFPFLRGISAFFRKLDRISASSIHAKYFIALDYIFGIHREQDWDRGLRLLKRLQNVCNRIPVKAMKRVPDDLLRDYKFNVACFGPSGSRKSKFLMKCYEKVTGNMDIGTGEAMVMNHTGKDGLVQLNIRDMAALEGMDAATRFFMHEKDCIVIFYDSTNIYPLSEVMSLHNEALKVSTNPGICVVQGLTKVEPNAAAVQSVVDWCNRHNYPHISTFNEGDSVYHTFLDAVTEQSMNTVSRPRLQESEKLLENIRRMLTEMFN